MANAQGSPDRTAQPDEPRRSFALRSIPLGVLGALAAFALTIAGLALWLDTSRSVECVRRAPGATASCQLLLEGVRFGEPLRTALDGREPVRLVGDDAGWHERRPSLELRMDGGETERLQLGERNEAVVDGWRAFRDAPARIAWRAHLDSDDVVPWWVMLIAPALLATAVVLSRRSLVVLDVARGQLRYASGWGFGRLKGGGVLQLADVKRLATADADDDNMRALQAVMADGREVKLLVASELRVFEVERELNEVIERVRATSDGGDAPHPRPLPDKRGGENEQ